MKNCTSGIKLLMLISMLGSKNLMILNSLWAKWDVLKFWVNGNYRFFFLFFVNIICICKFPKFYKFNFKKILWPSLPIKTPCIILTFSTICNILFSLITLRDKILIFLCYTNKTICFLFCAAISLFNLNMQLKFLYDAVLFFSSWINFFLCCICSFQYLRNWELH